MVYVDEFNANANRYNAKVDELLGNEKLLANFNIILEEQKSVLIIDYGVSEESAEAFVTNFENVRRIVEGLT